MAHRGRLFGRPAVHVYVPCAFVLPPADDVWHRRIAVQRMFLRHPGRCTDQDAGDIHFLFHSIWTDGIIHDFVVVNLHLKF